MWRLSRSTHGSDASTGQWPHEFPENAKNEYDLPTIGKWLENFLKRFFGFSQFKRSAMPNGPKVSSGGALSPRGDWRAPSDAVADLWLAEWPKSCRVDAPRCEL